MYNLTIMNIRKLTPLELSMRLKPELAENEP